MCLETGQLLILPAINIVTQSKKAWCLKYKKSLRAGNGPDCFCGCVRIWMY